MWKSIHTAWAGWYQTTASMRSTAASVAASATMAAPTVIYGLTQSDYSGAISLGIGIGIAIASAGRAGIGTETRNDLTGKQFATNDNGIVSDAIDDVGGPFYIDPIMIEAERLGKPWFDPIAFAGLFGGVALGAGRVAARGVGGVAAKGERRRPRAFRSNSTGTR